jgi:hypothetical protein
MEIPDLVRGELDGESVETAVNLGDDDVVCFTPTRTLVYRGDGLLSDEAVEVFAHDVERLGVSEGRRKTKFSLEYVDGTETFTIPGSRTEAVLERLVSGVLRAAGVVTDEESVLGVFRFSELTLVVTDRRLVKHVGAPVWDSDQAVYPYESVTGLSFEEGSVATQVVLSVDGRPDRIKAPNDEAPVVRETLTDALLSYYDVESLEALNQAVAPEEEPAERSETDVEFGDGLSPLVGDEDATEEPATGQEETGPPEPSRADTAGTGGQAPDAGEAGVDDAHPGAQVGADTEETATRAQPGPTGSTAERADAGVERSGSGQPRGRQAGSRARESGSGAAAPEAPVDRETVEEMQEQLAALTEVIERQNQKINDQEETLMQLIDELRRGR